MKISPIDWFCFNVHFVLPVGQDYCRNSCDVCVAGGVYGCAGGVLQLLL